MGYGVLFMVGLLTSVHCIAMCGGINLSQCLPNQNAADEETEKRTFLPTILYNLGRVISYTVIGFLLGLIGWLIGGSSGGMGVPTVLQGILKWIAGVFMVIMGINMLGIFPWLRRFSIQMPRFVARFIHQKRTVSVRPFMVGLLNGLMPCGPLQSMQILVLASANPFTGALSMFMFGLGTVPLMLGLGSVVSVLGKRFTSAVANIGAVLVTILGIAMLGQGSSLIGLFSEKSLLFFVIGLSVIGFVSVIPFKDQTVHIVSVASALICVSMAGVVLYQSDRNALQSDVELQLVDGTQQINSILLPGQYPTITVVAGIPVRWTIDAPKENINGCNYKMLIPEYGIEYAFHENENVIEFTSTEAGTFFIHAGWE